MSHAARRLIFALALLVPAGGTAFGASNDLNHEIGEDGRTRLDAEGQFNCVPEAKAGGSPLCPYENTSRAHPSQGILVVDSYWSLPVFADPFAAREPGASPTATAGQGGNLARSTGDLPDVILPGTGKFLAWFGRWNDLDQDGLVDLRYTGTVGTVGNEFAPVFWLGGTLFSFVEPGNHPPISGGTSPSASDPDFSYVYQNVWVWTSQGSASTFGAHAFVDGSILGTYRVTTVNDPVFTPSERFVFTPGPASRIDIDLYAAVAPAPVADLYAATAWPIVQSLRDPGPTSCPPSCPIGPHVIGATPLAPAAEPTVGLVFARSLQETSTGSANSAEGRLGEFQESHHAWIDALPRVQPFVVMAGTSESGEAAMPPGELAVNVRLGVWFDFNRDGYVGVASSPDPYEYGARPVPDRYDDPRGEYIGMWNTTLEAFPTSLWITLTPDTTWGPNGVFTRNDAYACAVVEAPCEPLRPGGEVCEAHRFVASCFNPPKRATAFGSESLRVELGRSSERGFYLGPTVVVPDGSLVDGFTICTDATTVTHVSGGTPLDETVWDCDHVGRWRPPAPSG